MNYCLTSLSNGLRVLTVPMQERESAAVAIWVRSGGRFESAKISGVSHYLEHMLFKGTKKRNTRQIKEEIEGVGGVLNAFTSEEETCYYAKLLKPHYPKAMDVLSDMVNNATLDLTELNKERTVILEEIKMYRDLPSHYVHDLLGEVMWPGQPLGRPVAGTVESVSGIKRSQMRDYMKRYYHPKNILVSVSGPVEHKEVVAQAEEYFSRTSSQPAASFSKAKTHQTRPKTHFVEKNTEQTHLVIGLRCFSRFHPDRYKLGVLNVLMGGNMSSRLFEEVREKRGLAYEVKSGVNYFFDTGAFVVSAGVEAKKAPTAIQVILKELAKLKRKPPSAGELRRAKDYFTSQLFMALEDTLDHLMWVGERVLDRNELPSRDEICKNIEAVTEKDVTEVAQNIFRSSHLNLALIGPIPSKVQKQIAKDFEVDGH